jgi:serine/threonine protein phosphatase PrpC
MCGENFSLPTHCNMPEPIHSLGPDSSSTERIVPLDAFPNSGPPMTGARLSWRAIAKSVRGTSHDRAGLPNQDAFLLYPSEEGLIVALSDGHGSAKSFRSEHGAKFAVEACIAEAQALLTTSGGQQGLTLARRCAKEQLPERIVRLWRRKVQEHIRAHPLTTEESAKVEGKELEPSNEDQIADACYVWYGATLLAAVVNDDFAIYFQLGDGEILTVSVDGKTTCPMPPDDRLLGNSTTSLCTETAWRDFRVEFLHHTDTSPDLILLCTDGYVNAFVGTEEFLQAGGDFQRLVLNVGMETVAEHLEGWLTDASAQGSGDDVTLAIIRRESSVK